LWGPWDVIGMGVLYFVQATPLSREYSVLATPEMLSVAVSVTRTSVPFQPAKLGGGVIDEIVTGGVKSSGSSPAFMTPEGSLIDRVTFGREIADPGPPSRPYIAAYELDVCPIVPSLECTGRRCQ
jgi:hypothetical protein